MRAEYLWPFLGFNPVALQVPGSEYLLDLMDHSMENQTVCHFGERVWRVLPSLYVKGIVGRCRKKIGISLLQQIQVTPQVPDTEQYSIELISEPLEKYSVY